jgi:uncharacterized protein YjbI with pentapeptide repeats
VDAYLHKASIIDSLMFNVDFEKSFLVNARIQTSQVLSCSFRKTKLTGAEMRQIKLSDCDFFEAMAEGAKFTSVSATNTNFRFANLGGAIFEDTVFHHTDFSFSTFTPVTEIARKQIAILKNTNFFDTTFYHADVRGVDFRHTNLTPELTKGMIFDSSTLFPFELSQVSPEAIQIKPNTFIKNADFCFVYLMHACLQNSELLDSLFLNAKVNYANFDRCNLRGSNFTSADASFASFKGANLENACFHSSMLHNTDLSEANLCNADMRFATKQYTSIKILPPLISRNTTGIPRIHGATYNAATRWPSEFNPVAYGAIKVNK